MAAADAAQLPSDLTSLRAMLAELPWCALLCMLWLKGPAWLQGLGKLVGEPAPP